MPDYITKKIALPIQTDIANPITNSEDQIIYADPVVIIKANGELSDDTSVVVTSLPSIPAGNNTIGSIVNTGFNVTGTLPSFATIPAFKIDQSTPGSTNKVDIGTDGIVGINSIPLPPNAATDITLQQVRDAIKAQIDIASTLWTDNSGVYYVRRDSVNESTGVISITFTTPDGTTVTPGAGLRPVEDSDKNILTDFYDVITNGTGYSIGDLLARVAILDTSNPSSPNATFIWLNFTTGNILSPAPSSSNIQRASETTSVSQEGTWNINNIIGTVSLPIGASTSSLQNTNNSLLTTTNNYLSTLANNSTVKGQTNSANSTPVVIANDQSSIPVTLDNTDSTYLSNLNTSIGTPITGVSLPNGSGFYGWLSNIFNSLNTYLPNTNNLPSILTGISSILTKTNSIDSSLTSISTKTPPLGQTTSTNSSPVVIANDQSVLPVTITTGTLPPYSDTPTFKIDQSNLGVTNRVNIGNEGVVSISGTTAISAVQLPLPIGASTSVLQNSTNTLLTTANNYLYNIATNTVGVGQAPSSNSSPVVIASDQSTLTVTLDNTDSTYLSNLSSAIGTPINGQSLSSGSGWFGWLSNIFNILNTKLPSLGQNNTTNSLPVVLPASQVTALTPPTYIAVSSIPSLPSGGNTIGAISNTGFASTQSGYWDIRNLTGTISLPTGASTSDNQTSANLILNSIDGKTPALGQALASGSVPVVLPASQLSTLTPPTTVGINGTLPAFTNTPTFNLGSLNGASTSANQTTAINSLSNIVTNTANIPAQGQALSSASLPVVLPASQIAALTPPTTIAASQSGTWNVNNINGVISLPTGAATSANQTTANSSLSSIATNTANIPPLGQALSTQSIPVVLPASQLSTLTPLSSVSLSAGSNVIGSISNTGFSINGTLPAFSSTPTFNLGTLNGAATATNQTTAITSLSAIATSTSNIPAQGQALSSASLPVVLPASQITALTPPTTIAFSNSSIGVSSLPSLPTGTNNIGSISSISNTVTIKADTAANQSNALKVDGSAVVQPINSSLYVFPAETQLTNVGTTSSRNVSSYCNITCQYTIAGLTTNTVTIRLEASIDGTTWFNLDPTDSDTTITTNKTSAFILSNVALYNIRFNLVSLSGGSPTVSVRFMAN